MDRICKFLHCLYMGITEAPNDAKRNDRPKEPDNKHKKIISIEPQSLQDGVRRMYDCESLYMFCMEDRCAELGSTRYLFSSISHSFFGKLINRSIDEFLKVYMCIIFGYNVYNESIILFVCYNLELKLSAINVCLYHITLV